MPICEGAVITMRINESLCTLIVCLFVVTAGIAQRTDATDLQKGNIIGTVTDVNNDTVPGATVVLEGPVLRDHRTVVANNNGFFKLENLASGTTYHVSISAR